MTPIRPRRARTFVPEVVQTSSMDCGVASVKSLVGGFGIDVSYGRLREACQTDIDGTSINVMERLVNTLGLSATQVIVPVDHVLLPGRETIPAIAVVRLPNGFNHFVVLWRRHGGVVQVMDPARGRRWPGRDSVERDLHVHRARVPRAMWQTWAATADFLDPLRLRMRHLGVHAIDPLIERALQEPGGARIAQLDAAVRMTAQLRRAGAVRHGGEASGLIERLIEEAPNPATDTSGSIPAHHWFVTPVDDQSVTVRGAVLVKVDHKSAPRAPMPAIDAADLLEAGEQKPARHMWRLVLRQWPLMALALTGLALLALGGIVEAILLRGVIDIGYTFALAEDRLTMFLPVPAFLLLLAGVDAFAAAVLFRLGNVLETHARAEFLRKIPRVANRFLQSRLMSDMAERCHTIGRLRLFPLTIGQAIRIALELMVTAAAVAWLDPAGAPFIVAAVLLSLAAPFVIQRVLTERDLRVRNLNGSMMRFYLDSLRGLFALRTHGAERAILREHETLLVEWKKAWLALHRTNLGVEAVLGIAGFAAAVILVAGYLDRWPQQAGIVLVLYWVLNVPQLGVELSQMSRQYPAQRNTMLRLTEVLTAPEEYSDAPSRPLGGTTGMQVELENVRVVAGGHTVLDNMTLQVSPGMHVAVIGRSGAGKSTLLGLLLGWHRPAAGAVKVDGITLDEGLLATVRQQSAWVDPAVQLWNTSLFNNLAYGAGGAISALDRVVSDADLAPVLSTLPSGFQGSVGDGGSLLSGGEGQRVRIGRAMNRPRARLVLLDEPFRGLTREQRRTLLDRARELWRDATMLCVTHDVGDTRTFDRVVIVEGGRIVEQGAPADLAADSSSRYHQLLDAEDDARATLWESAGWTRLAVNAGRVERNGASR